MSNTTQPDGGPAFPMPTGPMPRQNESTHYNEGMPLRDYFAAHALQGLLANASLLTAIAGKAESRNLHAFYAEGAYHYADAMLEERKRNQ